MASSADLKSIDAHLKRTARDQADASDPRLSVWVSANAGTGKTHVLTMRVLRLMLAGTAPEKILCLTYTKAAAAEMSKRVFDELAKWVTAPRPVLVESLGKLTGTAPAPETISRARTLFTAAIETPGGLKVQTIHAFAERLLQRFPLEAGIAPGFSILDEEESRSLRRDAIDHVLGSATRAPSSQLGRALTTVIAYAVDDTFDELLGQALSNREWLTAAGYMGFDEVDATLRRHFGVPPDATREKIEAEFAGLIPKANLTRLRDALLGGTKTDVNMAEAVTAALGNSPAERIDAFAKIFLKSNGDPREKFLTKALQSAHPDLDAMLTRAQTRYLALAGQLSGLDVVAATMALTRIADAVMEGYTRAKNRRGVLDFDDLIDKASSLLRVRESAEWVLFKLDGGLDHILVDESQDTAPAQWRVIEALAGEFFSGLGAREEARTIFAVGDEKQSIYSFQGAAPEKFAEMGARFAESAANAGAAWKNVPLNLSFRSVEPILAAVDAVFAEPDRTPGLTAGGETIRHFVRRFGQAGSLEIWPSEAFEDTGEADPWSPLDEETRPTPVARLANKIADTIQGWLTSAEMLQSENRPIRAGDILILVRKRNPFAAPMVAALKARGIAVAGADRIRLTEQIAVQDLVALGDFLTLPEDDLALASVLKSPLFGFDDDNLLDIAPLRKGSLWKALLDNAPADPVYETAAATLKRWRAHADFTPPYEFFASLLDKDGMRTKLLSRLGPDAADGIDEFLNQALTYDDRAPPSLSGFLHHLRTGTREVKRDMEHGRNEVRVMTVHGAKGLEAPIVFLPDTCTTASAGRQGGGLVKLAGVLPPPTPDPVVWGLKGTSKLAGIAEARARNLEREKAELNRLLYVAMTRARDRLYVAGFENKNGRAKGCWYDLISSALSQREAPGTASVIRITSSQTEPHETPKATTQDDLAGTPLPAWAATPAPREPQLSVPLAPSRLAPYEVDETGEPSPAPPPKDSLAEPASPSPALLAGDGRFLRGTLTHALLQHLPSLDKKTWGRAAKAFVAKRAAGLSARTRDSIVSETLAVLDDPLFAPLFGPLSRAEVAIAASIPRPRGSGPALKLTGQIDRLADTGREVFIVDYKTNRPPPHDPAKVADVYLYQLAAYRLGVAEIFKGRPVRAAILWTETPRIMEIPSELLDEYARRLWTLDTARLEAP